MQTKITQVAMHVIVVFAIFTLALFLPTGTMAWPAGWIFMALFFSFAIFILSWLYLHNPGLLKERMRLGTSDQKGWDKILFPLLQIVLLAWLVFMGLDTGRYHWSYVPIWLQGVGGMILLCSFYLLFLTFRENSYLSPVVRLQEERGQIVISSGPYHYLRHPMYSAILIFILGASLLLGSSYGIIVGFGGVMILAKRAVLEEATLLKDLSGYADYMAKVKYRIIPFIW
jgi:protein-S-isoprenylcysteine O-methyltransferase Ste14